jgi:hypothetical protein
MHVDTDQMRSGADRSLLGEVRRRLLAARPDDAQTWPGGWSAVDTAIGRTQDSEQRGDLSG